MIEYKGYEIDTSIAPGVYCVLYMGDEVAFDSIEEAMAFIDNLND